MHAKWPGGRPWKILFTEGSSTSARQALYSLGRRHTIDLLDPNWLCQCRFSRLVRRWYRCPLWSRDPLGYLEVLAERLKAGQYDVLLPTHEQIYLLSRVRDYLTPHVGVALPEFDTLDRLMSKANFVRLLDEVGLPQPEATIVRTRDELEQDWQFPCWVKLDYSTAGEGVRQVANAHELRQVADDFERRGWLNGQNEIIVQQPARGIKGSVTGVFDHGRLVAANCVQARALGVGGSSMGQISVWYPIEVEHVRRLGEYLNWHGAMVLELCYDEATGEPQYLECNPRMGETTNSLLADVNVAEQLVLVSHGAEVEMLPANQVGVRTHQGYLILMARSLQGANRRQLLREIWQTLRGQGLYEASQDEMSRPYDDWPSALPYLGIALLLLANPHAAQWIVTTTVNNYCLPSNAVNAIRTLPLDRVAEIFGSPAARV